MIRKERGGDEMKSVLWGKGTGMLRIHLPFALGA